MTEIKHNLTDEQLADLETMVKEGVSRWQWVLDRKKDRIVKPQLEINNGVINRVKADSEHTDAEVVEAIYSACSGRRERRRVAAKKAAATREKRRLLLIDKWAKKYIDGIREPSERCHICSKRILDKQSRKRGIGSDCWQHVLQRITAQRERDELVIKISLEG